MGCSTNSMENGKLQMVNGKRWQFLLTFAIFLFPFAMSSLWACPLCKDALTQRMAQGFNSSILLMLAVPALVVGAIAGALWRAGQKRRGLPGAPHE